METLLQTKTPAHLMVLPDYNTGVPMLAGWIGVVAYVIAFAGIHGTGSDSSGVSQWVQKRNIEMDLYKNESADGCDCPYEHACGHYSTVNGISPFRMASATVAAQLKQTEIYKHCSNNVHFDTCKSKPEDTLQNTLLTGMAVRGWVARAGLHEGRVALHVFNVEAEDRQDRAVNRACVFDIFTDYQWSDDEHDYEFDVVLYDNNADNDTDDGSGENDNSFCSLKLHWETNTDHENYTSAAPDCPTNCQHVVEQLAPTRVAQELSVSNYSLQRLKRLADSLKAAAGVNTSIYFGGGPGLNVDRPLQGNVSHLWEQRLVDEINLLGVIITRPVWAAAANEVNAFYDPCQNSIFVPSGMLTPPFYHEEYDDELVAGGIGFVIAHELGHAMDHNLNESEVRVAVVKHMAAITNTPQLVVNHTVSEDVADELGGQLLANTTTLTARMGYQLAQCWCLSPSNFSSDVHAPGSARVNTLMTPGGSLNGILCK
jgi:hypothetical protein